MEESKGTAGKSRRTKVAAGTPAGARAGGKLAKSGGGKSAAAKAKSTPAARAPRKVVAVPSPSPAEREQRVRIAAYLRAERRGFAPGYEVEDWLAAEAEIELGSPPGARLPKSAARKPRSG